VVDSGPASLVYRVPLRAANHPGGTANFLIE
jgi:hypothetical protein